MVVTFPSDLCSHSIVQRQLWSVGLLLFVKGLSEPNLDVSGHTLLDRAMRLTE